jgi:hypothetical protein
MAVRFGGSSYPVRAVFPEHQTGWSIFKRRLQRYAITRLRAVALGRKNYLFAGSNAGIRPGHAGHRRYRMAFYFSNTGTVLQRVINRAVGRVRRGGQAAHLRSD